jgi:hypothetical protein
VVVLLAQVLGTVPSFMVPFITESPIPVLYAPFKTYDVRTAPHLATFRIELGAWGSAVGAQSFTLHLQVMRMMEGHTAKLTVDDTTRTEAVLSHYERHIDFDRLLHAVT